MDEKKESKSSIPLPAIMLIFVFIAGGVSKYYAPLESMRPSHSARSVEVKSGEENVLSRMWQDPLQAIEKHMSKIHNDDPIVHDYHSQLGSKDKPILILPVYTPAGYYAEDSEKRLRNRYALLSALHVAGFRPNKSSHIGAFNLKDCKEQYLRDKYGDPSFQYDLDFYTPFEWFVPDTFLISEKNQKNIKYKSILIIWLSDETFDEETIFQLEYLRVYLIEKLRGNAEIIDYKIIGPSNSSILERMLEEAYDRVTKITVDDIVDWNAILKLRHCDKNNLLKVLLRTKLKSSTCFEEITMLDVEIKKKIIVALNDITDDLLVYYEIIPGKKINLSFEEEKKLKDLNLNNILEKSGLSVLQKENIKWLRIDLLKQFLPQTFSKRGNTKARSNNIEMYSPWSTAVPFFMSDRDFIGGDLQSVKRIVERLYDKDKYEVKDKSFDELSAAGINFNRTIHTDLSLTDALVEELDQRGVELSDCGSDHIVLINEWDSSYGRALPLSFAISIEEHRKKDREDNVRECCKSDVDSNFPDRIHRLAYMHGIDGMLPVDEGDSDRSDMKKLMNTLQKSNSSADKSYYKPDFNQPLGEAQYDYIRRLTQKIKQLPFNDADENISKRSTFDHKIRAIGVLGSDIYDKLLILRALRPEYPDAIFFTNDLDARLFHETELKWTRNLIVASSYGLQLHPSLQRDIPPFRNNYQTSLFAATLQALGLIKEINLKKNEAGSKLIAPRIFEIGRKGPYDLTPFQNQKNDKAATLHPLRYDQWQKSIIYWEFWLYIFLVLVLPLLLFGILIYYRMYGISEIGSYRIPKPKKPIVLWLITFGLPCFISFVSLTFIVFFDSWNGYGEPLTFFDSISIWPAVLTRLFCGFLAIYFIILSIQYQIYNRVAINARLDKSSVSDNADSVNIKSLWEDYKEHEGGMRECLQRAGLSAITYLFAICILLTALGWPPVPFRGKLSFYTDSLILGFSLLFMSFLAWFVFNRVYYCRRFFSHIDDLHQDISVCEIDKGCSISEIINEVRCVMDDEACQGKVSYCLDKYGKYLSNSVCAEYSKIWVIAERTEAIGKMILYSFIVFALLLISRNQFFDCWTWPTSLIFVICVSICVGAYYSFILFYSANTIRRKTINRLYLIRLQLIGIQIPSIQKKVYDEMEGIKKYSLNAHSIKEKKDKINVLSGEQRLINDDISKLIESKTKHLECIIKDIQDLKHGAFTPLGRNHLLIAVLTPLGGMGSLAILPHLIQLLGK